METALVILVIILSITLFLFLVCGIIFLIKLIRFIDLTKNVVKKGESVATQAEGVASNLREMTSVGGMMRHLVGNVAVIKQLIEQKKAVGDEKNDGQETLITKGEDNVQQKGARSKASPESKTSREKGAASEKGDKASYDTKNRKVK